MLRHQNSFVHIQDNLPIRTRPSNILITGLYQNSLIVKWAKLRAQVCTARLFGRSAAWTQISFAATGYSAVDIYVNVE